MKKIFKDFFCKNLFLLSLFPFYDAYKAYEQKNYEITQDILEKEQIDKPNDRLINYNLGTTYYKQKNYDLAKESFQRAAASSFGKDNNILEKSYFNLGNAFYQKTLSILPPDWEKQEKIDPEILKSAINEIKQSIEKYDQIVKANEQNEKAKTNKKAAEEILKKLQKQQQDQKNQKDDKKDKDKQKDEQDKKDDQQKQDQQNKDKEKKDNKQEQDQKQQDQQQPKQEQKQSFEKRRAQAALSKLEQNEKKLQKKLFKQKVKSQKKPDNKYQRPW